VKRCIGKARGPQLVQAGETAADDLINVFRWGDDRLAPGNWVEAGTGSKPVDYSGWVWFSS
jgi:hypothetical protein